MVFSPHQDNLFLFEERGVLLDVAMCWMTLRFELTLALEMTLD